MSNANIPFEHEPNSRVLREDELDAVSGGTVSHSPLLVKKLVDASSPLVFS